jgi:hypothetical protein
MKPAMTTEIMRRFDRLLSAMVSGQTAETTEAKDQTSSEASSDDCGETQTPTDTSEGA